MNFDVLEKVRKKKTLLSLPWAEMEELKQFLAHNFGIEQSSDGYDYFETIRDKCGDRIADEFETLNDIRALGTPSDGKEAEKKFYDLICEDPLLGIVHSEKWTCIFEAMSYVTSLARLVGFKGTVLDIGCHAGYQTLWLGQALQCHSRGIDASRAAIHYARTVGEKLGLTPRVATFDKVDFGKDSYSDLASLVLAAGLPMDLQELFEKAAAVMSDPGLFVWIGRDEKVYDDSVLRAALMAAGLTIELMDVIGGWGQEQGVAGFGADLVLVLRHGTDHRVPEDFQSETQSIWNHFAEYANTPGRPNDEKTIGQYRTFATHGSKHGQ
jgi:hypothetical protein